VTLLDTNIIIDARAPDSPFHQGDEELIAHALAHDGATINAIVLAELCVGQRDPMAVTGALRLKGLAIADLPAAAAAICARAFTEYRQARRRSGGGDAPAVPLPDFFIGAHAELMGWILATRDSERIRMYFPTVHVLEPQGSR